MMKDLLIPPGFIVNSFWIVDVLPLPSEDAINAEQSAARRTMAFVISVKCRYAYGVQHSWI